METAAKIEGLEVVYTKPKTLTDTPTHYCPGCGHGVVHKILMEVIEEMGIQEETIGVAPVGCAVFAYDYMNIDMQEAPHGRASAVATGVKRVLPEKYVFSYQGNELHLQKAVSDINPQRAVYINDYMYIASENSITILDERTWEKVKDISL